MKKLFDKIADYFIPKTLGLSSVEMIKARVLVNSCFLASSLMILSGINRFFLTEELPISVLFGIAFLITIPFLLKKTGNFKLVVYAMPTAALIVLPILVYYRGGLASVPGLWLIAVPILSLYFIGPKHGLIYSLIAVSTLVIILHLKIQGHQFPTNEAWSVNGLHLGIGMICLFVFITYLTWHYEKSTLENQGRLKLSEQRALQANKTKDIFWANMSHEIRTPLNGILGMTNLLLDSRLSADQKELLHIIRDSAENLNIILSDVIDYSKIESNELEIQKKPFSLIKALDQVIQLFQHMAHEKNINISYSIDTDVPYGILTDESRLRQILMNLVANAIKFTDNGFVKILVERGSRRDIINFTIEDTGIGIAQDKMDKLFKPFTQVDDGNSRKYGGTGLGLVICKKLVEVLGGKVIVESQLGQGSSFSFYIRAMPVQIKARQSTGETSTGMGLHLTKTIPLKVLVVEDNPVNRRLLISLLNKNGYNPDVAEDGLLAIEKCEQRFYDLIFMDIQMPNMDGISATKKIIELYPENRPKIVAVTANVLQEDRDKYFEAGMDDFMAKPINNNILMTVLERYSKQVLNLKDAFMDYEEESLTQEEARVPKIGPEEDYKSFDVRDLMENFSEDIFVIETIAKQFSDKYRNDLVEIEEAIVSHNFQNLELRAHSLKGSFASLFCKKGLSYAIQLERMGKTGNVEDASEVLDELRVLCGELTEELEIFLSYRQAA